MTRKAVSGGGDGEPSAGAERGASPRRAEPRAGGRGSAQRTRRRGHRAKRDGRQSGARGTARDSLLDAAARVFAERGYRATSVDDVAAAAGLSKGAVYWNFDGKEALFFALLEERLDRGAAALFGLTAGASAEQETAQSVSRGVHSLVDEQRDAFLLLQEYWALAARDARLRRRYLKRQRALRDGLAATLEARHSTTGVPLTVPAERVATAVLALATGLAMEELVDPDAVPEDLFGEMLSLIYDGNAARARAAQAQAAEGSS
jgi:AcrR family transcriptional regulator